MADRFMGPPAGLRERREAIEHPKLQWVETQMCHHSGCRRRADFVLMFTHNRMELTAACERHKDEEDRTWNRP